MFIVSGRWRLALLEREVDTSIVDTYPTSEHSTYLRQPPHRAGAAQCCVIYLCMLDVGSAPAPAPYIHSVINNNTST